MENKKTAVFGIYPTSMQAERAVDELGAGGLPERRHLCIAPGPRRTRDMAHQKDTKAPEGTTTGVIAGGVMGGNLGMLGGSGTLAIPGLGPFIAAGPIMAGLAGLGAGGAVGGIDWRPRRDGDARIRGQTL